jgi:hypothetical protein
MGETMFSMFRNTAVSLGAAALGLSLVAVPNADAAYVAYIYQNGANVVVTGSGSIDLTDMSLFGANGHTFAATMFPGIGVIITGPAAIEALDEYTGYTGPPSFGGFSATDADSGSGDIVGLDNFQGPNPTLYVPAGYVSGHALSDSATYDNATFFGLHHLRRTHCDPAPRSEQLRADRGSDVQPLGDGHPGR